MHPVVDSEVVPDIESAVANLALIRLLSGMDPKVVLPGMAVLELPLTVFAFIRRLSRMHSQMFLIIGLPSKPLLAKRTHLRLRRMHFGVRSQIR